MALLAKLDDGGGPAPPPVTPKPGSSSPPPSGASSPGNQPSNSNNGKKPESGKNKNNKQPDAKKPAATQPVTAPKGETLAEAIKRMFAAGWNGHQVHDQIKKWHPNWTEYQIDQAMMRAPKSPKESGEPTRPLLSPSDEAWIRKHRHDQPTHFSDWVGREFQKLERGAKDEIKQHERRLVTTLKHDERVRLAERVLNSKPVRQAIRIDERVLEIEARGIEWRDVTDFAVWARKHPDLVAAGASSALLIPGLDVPAAVLLVGVAFFAGVDAGATAFRRRDYLEAFLDFAAISLGPASIEARTAERAALEAENEAQAARAAARTDSSVSRSKRVALVKHWARQARLAHAEVQFERSIVEANERTAAILSTLGIHVPGLELEPSKLRLGR